MAAVEMNIVDFFSKCEFRINQGYMLAALTDEYIVCFWPDKENEKHIIENEDKVMEIRVFNASLEMKLARSDISKSFLCRCIDDLSESLTEDFDMHYAEDCLYDEWQILDIDETKGKGDDGKVTATGGGRYFLPLKDMAGAAVKIRYYLGRYPETGQAIVADWRVVSFGNIGKG